MLIPYLWVDIQDTDASSFHYFMDGVNLGAVEVTHIHHVRDSGQL